MPRYAIIRESSRWGARELEKTASLTTKVISSDQQSQMHVDDPPELFEVSPLELIAKYVVHSPDGVLHRLLRIIRALT